MVSLWKPSSSIEFPNISEERPEEPDIIFPDDEFGGNFQFEGAKTPFKPTTSEIAKQAGVSINDPADIKARFGASLGYNEDQKALAIKILCQKCMGKK